MKSNILLIASLMAGSVVLSSCDDYLTSNDGWISMFSVVAQSINTIERIEKYAGAAVSQGARTQGIAEARFMRGVAYWYIGSLWNTAVLYTSTSAMVQNYIVAPNRVTDVMEFAIRDLEYAAANLASTAPQECRLSSYAAYCMMSRIYLSMAGLTTEGQYDGNNIATDHNQLTMEIMQKVAAKHGLVCLLHEKPFAGVNGSGKHNNWSMATDTGVNLLSPGETPYENAQFLLFLCAVIKAVDDYQDLLRLSVATAGNDHRLGANEAPPAVVSIFLGDELMGILDAIENDAPYSGTKKTTMKLGVDVLPRFPRDTTDRNRTSPFAFTGNKFEFRMLGSSNSIACANIMLNAAVAESLKIYADRLEGAEDFETALHDMIKKTIKDHKRIIFNGNGYDATWIKEATEVRGLCNYPTTPDCMPHLLDKKNVDMLTAHKIYSVSEIQARCDIMLENYCKAVIIEANTMVDMARKQILPAVEGYAAELAASVAAKKAVAPNLACAYETGLVTKLSGLTDQIAEKTDELESAVLELKNAESVKEESFAIRDTILGKMAALRAVADEAETQTSSDYWPFPTYGELLFGVK